MEQKGVVVAVEVVAVVVVVVGQQKNGIRNCNSEITSCKIESHSLRMPLPYALSLSTVNKLHLGIV